MTTRIHKSKYFCGSKISNYGLREGYLDYHTFSKAFDAVLVNDITKLFGAYINGDWSEAEYENGFYDYQEELEDIESDLDALYNEPAIKHNEIDTPEYEFYKSEIERLEELKSEYENERDYLPEIYQYYIVSDPGAELIKKYTNDPLFYLPALDCYVWGVCHWGTSWEYVLTDVKLEIEEA